MGNLRLYVKNAKKRSVELQERFLTRGGEPGIDLKELIAGLTEEARALYEERAGIMELDGGLSREEAEREALRAVLEKGKT